MSKKVYKFVIPGRAPSKKNSRRNMYGGGNRPSRAFEEWYKASIIELKTQWKKYKEKDPLDGLYSIEVIQYRKNWQHANDIDAPLTSAMDLIKGLVIVEDNPKYIRKATSEMIFGCQQDELVIVLTPYESLSEPKEGDEITIDGSRDNDFAGTLTE